MGAVRFDMPTDQDALQGLWRLVSCVARGCAVSTGTTHVAVEGDRFKEIQASKVDGGDWATFEIDATCRPKRFTMTSSFTSSRGKNVTRVDRWVYELDGDTLRLCWPSVFGQYPDAVSPEAHGVMTMIRHEGAPPPTRKASGKEPIAHPTLGALTWNDEFENWETSGELSPGKRIQMRVAVIQPSAAAVVAAFSDMFRWLRKHEPAARRFAASELLDTYNASWNEGAPISARSFTNRMTLAEVSVGTDGTMDLDYDVGDLFGGHGVVVYTDEDRAFASTDIAG